MKLRGYELGLHDVNSEISFAPEALRFGDVRCRAFIASRKRYVSMRGMLRYCAEYRNTGIPEYCAVRDYGDSWAKARRNATTHRIRCERTLIHDLLFSLSLQ